MLQRRKYRDILRGEDDINYSGLWTLAIKEHDRLYKGGLKSNLSCKWGKDVVLKTNKTFKQSV